MPVAATAVTWMVFIIVVFLFPSSSTPTSANMNYTIVVWGKSCLTCRQVYLTFGHAGGTLVLAVAYYYFPVYGGIHWFKGPVQTIQLTDLSSRESQHSDVKEDTESAKHPA